MFYVFYCEDAANSLPLRKANRPAHLERLRALQAEGRLLLAGPFPAVDNDEPGEAGFTGSLIVAEFDALISAQEWAEQDPYVQSGVYAKVTVLPFKKVILP